MNRKEFQQKLVPIAKKIKPSLPDESSSSLRLLAEILLVWYERRMAEREAEKK